MAGIELDGVAKRFDGVTAVDGVSLRVPEGDLLVLVGPSGCGKTTLLRAIAGLDRPSAGEVYLDGVRITDLPARKRDVSLVFQDFALFPHLTAGENVGFDLRMQGADAVDRRVAEVADLLGIADLLERPVDALSGGQKQRVALGRALATEPSAFLLDEPLANLDANLRERMRTEIARLQERLGVTTVHVTHDQAEALTMGDRVAVMREGRVVQAGTPEAVYREPASLFVARFVGSPTMNLLPGRLDGGTLAVETDEGDELCSLDGEGGAADTAAAAEPPSEVVVGVRPERVQLSTDGGHVAQAFTARVGFDEFHGADRFVHLEAEGVPDLVSRQRGGTEFADGLEVAVSFPPDAVHVFDRESGQRLTWAPAVAASGEPGPDERQR